MRLLWTAVAIVALVAGVATGLAVASSKGGEAPACGVERWAVKTLQDPAGKALKLSSVTKTTVSSLRSRTVKSGPGGSRGSGVESTVYQVAAKLVEAKLEEDSDIHLVIRSLTSSGTMIVEFPAVTCASGATAGAKTR